MRVRGCVQGVGFRPNTWRLARECGLVGEVRNDSQGVLILAGGQPRDLKKFLARLERDQPPLSRIDRIDCRAFDGDLPEEFRISESVASEADTQVAPDAALCAACAAEIADPAARRFRYPFTNCTNCGPRLSIVRGVPYDRARTTMSTFGMCEECGQEYRDPADRRFHAQPIACPACGPQLALERLGVAAAAPVQANALDVVCDLLNEGAILAIKGLGGYQLACDARNGGAVESLRRHKHRDAKPFALMARDLAVVHDYCHISDAEAALLSGACAPIVLLRAKNPKRLPESVAPGLNRLGFMLPTTPLHRLLLQGAGGPLVMTSGNLSDEPQIIDDQTARERLSGVAAYALTHNREIANRVDDSVVRMMSGAPRILRRARGFAPAPIALPPEFSKAPPLLAFGGHLKATFCLLKRGEAILSQHQGDLEDALTFEDYRKNLALYAALFDHAPQALVADLHPDYLSSRLARSRSSAALPLIEVQHHHAHIAACLAENLYSLRGAPVLGLVLDGLGWGADGAIWGGELMLADYRNYVRLGALKPTPMPGGTAAIREPWRNLYAHLVAAFGRASLASKLHALELDDFLRTKPCAMLEAMLARGVNAPLASSCGRLFDAFAALLGLCRDRQVYEGQAGAYLEAAAEEASPSDAECGYPFTLGAPLSDDVPAFIDSAPMWAAALEDLRGETPRAIMAARFHKGLAEALVALTQRLARSGAADRRFDTVALSGGCLQNSILLEELTRRLEGCGFVVLTHRQVPANDGGLALGQAAVGAARLLES
ncbi:carbamoyltransferase HypF [Methylocystis bryophila]|uniref:Carbamoyltransferase HypF n=1 Tax=Methylocystis bryophila TaxID=655015 RepID=A0A1W6N138_9HYPH|nr:carbamoyltransferase HypF [Methylocystis bryophila]